MYETCQLIYDFREHGLYYKNYKDDSMLNKITLAIDTLQLDCDYTTGKLLSVSGYLPLFNVCRNSIEIPLCIEKEFFIQLENVEYIPGMAYDYFKFYPESKKYFIKEELPIVSYDENNKRIMIGDTNTSNSINIQLNKNITCVVDDEENLKAILLKLDEVIKE